MSQIRTGGPLTRPAPASKGTGSGTTLSPEERAVYSDVLPNPYRVSRIPNPVSRLPNPDFGGQF